jgi:large subunit ribosomal protein L15
MSRRKQGQKKGYLGHRSHGRGNVKNRRGSGNRGGRGMAGIDKHKWSWAMKNEPDYFGKNRFVRPQGTQRVVEKINLYEINQKALKNTLEKKNGKAVFTFEGKILGSGVISVPVEIHAHSWSKSVEEKLKAVGGSISKISVSKKSNN